MNEQSNDFGVGYAIGRDTNNGYGNGYGFGGDWIWAIILIALLGNGGWGFGGGGFGGGYGGGFMNYEIGRLATTNDVASGFSTSEIMSDLNDILLGQAQGFANVQQTLCQGFNGLQQTIMQGFHGVDNAVCTLGYQTQAGFNTLANQISSCCCDLKTMNLENRYLNEKQTCDIVNAINHGNQRIIDMYTSDKMASKDARIAALEAKLNNEHQTNDIVSALAPKAPIPAYPVFPTTSFAYPSGVTFGVGNNCGCGCNNGFGF